MKLIHTCPECGKDFEDDSVPEPSKLCEDCQRCHNVVKIEFWVDCGNCTMNKEEAGWYIDKIDELCKMRASKLKDINVYD